MQRCRVIRLNFEQWVVGMLPSFEGSIAKQCDCQTWTSQAGTTSQNLSLCFSFDAMDQDSLVKLCVVARGSSSWIDVQRLKLYAVCHLEQTWAGWITTITYIFSKLLFSTTAYCNICNSPANWLLIKMPSVEFAMGSPMPLSPWCIIRTRRMC